MLLLEVLILLAILIDIGISLYSHRKDSQQQEAYRDEEIEVLNQIADALNAEGDDGTK
jgi:hypothetical protein